MPVRLLAGTDLRVSALGFGCSTIASLGTRHSTAEVQATLLEAFDRGINFFDTADVYGQGDSERLLGRLFEGRREQVVICTKVGMRLAQSQAAIRLVKPFLRPVLQRWRAGHAQTVGLRRVSERRCFEPGVLRSRVEASLRRLRVDRLGLLLLHSPPPELAQHDELLSLLQGLRRSGKLRWFGVSVAELSHAPTWASWPELSCLQLPLSPVPGAGGVLGLPAETQALLASLQARGIGVIAREVFAGGALAAQAGARAQALAAVLAAPAVGVALVGMGSRAHLRSNLEAFASTTGQEAAA